MLIKAYKNVYVAISFVNKSLGKQGQNNHRNMFEGVFKENVKQIDERREHVAKSIKVLYFFYLNNYWTSRFHGIHRVYINYHRTR